jgi:hypothetical protein
MNGKLKRIMTEHPRPNTGRRALERLDDLSAEGRERREAMQRKAARDAERAAREARQAESRARCGHTTR